MIHCTVNKVSCSVSLTFSHPLSHISHWIHPFYALLINSPTIRFYHSFIYGWYIVVKLKQETLPEDSGGLWVDGVTNEVVCAVTDGVTACTGWLRARGDFCGVKTLLLAATEDGDLLTAPTPSWGLKIRGGCKIPPVSWVTVCDSDRSLAPEEI